jgi:hypothetical protein
VVKVIGRAALPPWELSVPVLKHETLLALLRSNTSKVKVLALDGKRYYFVPAERAIVLVGSEHFVGVGSNRRVRYLCESRADHRSFPVDSSWWKDRAVIKFHGDQRSPGRGRSSVNNRSDR